MDRSWFDTRANQLRAYARELLATIEDCVTQATNLVSGLNPTGLAGTSPDSSGASLALGRICRRIEDVMAADDRIQEALGGETCYEQVLAQLGARPEPERSRGLVDPRIIHPSPEGIFPDPVEVRPKEPDPIQRGPVDGAAESRTRTEEDDGTQQADPGSG